jgi:CheY-like chemotaxis protein
MKTKHTILIVDDDADDREIIKDAFLASDDHPECVFLENGEKLMQYLEVQPQNEMPSLILLDLNMPGKDGRESLKDIKNNKRFHHIPTVVFTTSSSYRDKQAVYDLGANCFVTKPDTFNQLTELTASISRLWLK